MADLLYLGMVLLFFLLSWGFLKLCQTLMSEIDGGHSFVHFAAPGRNRSAIAGIAS